MLRIAFLVIVATALAIIGGLDLRLALMSRELSVETAAALEQQGRPNGTRAVTFAELDQHERRVATFPATFAALDQHERAGGGLSSAGFAVATPAAPQQTRCSAPIAPSTFALLDQHERSAERCVTSR